MSEFDPRRPLSRPTTPVTTVWFEFLLDEPLLESHLSKSDPEPTATELIALFLYQADQAAASAKEIKDDDQSEENLILDARQLDNFPDTKKVKALRLLALRTAAFLKWDLDKLEANLPVALVNTLLLELLRVTLDSEPDVLNHHHLDLTTLPDQALFAVQLYHRWCVRTVIQDSFPVKPSKAPMVQVPGVLDPIIASADLKDPTMDMVKDCKEISIQTLEKCCQYRKSLRIPALKSFGFLKENEDVVCNDWSQGFEASMQELSCQLYYDVGCIRFFHQEYNSAYIKFQETSDLLKKMKEPVFCHVNKDRLLGYLSACGGVTGISIGRKIKQMNLNLVQKALNSQKHGYEGLIEILVEDNQKRELTLSYRISLEEQIKAEGRSDNLFGNVVICNMIRLAIEGSVLPSSYSIVFQTGAALLVNFLLKATSECISSCSFSQKNNLKYFMRYLCLSLPPVYYFVDKMLASDMNILFTEQEAKELKEISPELNMTPSFILRRNYPETEDESVRLAELERQLLVTYDIESIRDLSQKMTSHMNKTHVMHLSDKWKLPKELQRALDGIGVVKLQVLGHLLLSKSRICSHLELYDKALELVEACQDAVKEVSFRLSKQLRLEVTRLELLKLDAAGLQGISSLSPESREDAIKKAKSCSSVNLAETAVEATSFLLNLQAWDFLSVLEVRQNGHFQMCHLLACLCKEHPDIKNCRKPARDLWDAVILIFSSSNTSTGQQKRTNSGQQFPVTRENSGVLQPSLFSNFLLKIKDPLALSVMISLITKLFIILKNIASDISSDYLTLWPTALGNASSVNIPQVEDCVTVLMEHVLTLNPHNPSWLRTQADVCFARNQYAKCLHFYLQLGVVCTEYFSGPITKNVYDDQVYKKMVKCCSYLQCHTQVAVICQFMDETDYATAFKSLQEKNAHDAMDTYYEFMWDVTLLEYLVNLHNKRNEFEKCQKVVKLIGQPELNSSNPPDIQINAAVSRKARFFRAMAKLYL